MDEHFADLAEVEDLKNDLWAEHMKEADKKNRAVLNALHVSKELTFGRKIVMSGNKMDDGRCGRVYLGVGGERIDGLPNSRTKKGDLASFGQQDALDAAVALANIVEVVGPYAWREGEKKAQEKSAPASLGHGITSVDPDPERYAYPAQDLKDMSQGCAGWDLLVSEVSSFVDRFGLLHMTSPDRRFDNNSWLSHVDVNFFGDDDPLSLEDFRADWEKRLNEEIGFEEYRLLEQREYKKAGVFDSDVSPEERQTAMAKVRSELDCSQVPAEVVKEARDLVIERERRGFRQSGVNDLEGLYALKLSCYVKSFAKFSDYVTLRKDELARLAPIEEELGCLERERASRRHWKDDERTKERDARISDLRKRLDSIHLSFSDLVKASQDAVAAFGDRVESLAEHGVWSVNLHGFYNCSLLVHDALEMLCAIDGDEGAFRRILPRFHMERFLPNGEEDFARYTLWFESIGSDMDNPWPYDDRYAYKASVDGREVELARRDHPWERQTFGGRDWLYYRLLERTDGLDDFERLVRENLPFFVEAMISDGKSRRNYKGCFAPGARVTRDSLSYTVNDRDHDLMATIWSALELVRVKDIELDLSKCEVCGRLIRVKKQQRGGKRKKTCSDACRQSLSRGKVDEAAVRLRDDFNAFMESGAEIRIGVDEPAEEPLSPEPVNVFDSVLNAIFQAKRRRR